MKSQLSHGYITRSHECQSNARLVPIISAQASKESLATKAEATDETSRGRYVGDELRTI